MDRSRQERILGGEVAKSLQNKEDPDIQTVAEKKLEEFCDMADSMLRTDVCRHYAFDQALDSIQQEERCNRFCDHCYDREGLIEMF